MARSASSSTVSTQTVAGRRSQLFLVVSVVLLVGLGCCLAFLLAEIGFRLFAVSAVSGSRWNDRPEFYYKDERARTFQGAGYSQTKPEGVYRVAVLGDSFTFATSMQFDDSFPERLERMLNLNAGSRELQVINYGVPGFSTSHEVDTAAQAVAEGADLILLQITLNDPQIKHARPGGISGKNEFSEFVLEPDAGWIVGRSRVFQFVRQRLHNQQTHKAYIKYYYDLFESEQSWNRFAKSLLAIKKTAVRNNVQMAAIVFPLLGLPLNDGYPFHPLHEKIGKLLTRRGILTLDLFKYFEGLPLARIQVEPGVDFHPNEIAHRLAAERIYIWMVKSGLIPEEFIIKERFKRRLHVRPERNERLSPLAGERLLSAKK